MVTIGKKVKNFSRLATGDKIISLKDLSGKKVVLYFYPKDNTPGCTAEAKDFQEHHKEFERKRVVVIGISKDSLKKHKNFSEKFDLRFSLASDKDDQVCEAFGVWVEKNMYGKKYMGIERSTFLINEKGMIEKIWRKVKVDGHVREILDFL